MTPTGKGQRRVLIVAEAPGQTEDEQGVQLVGAAGRLLRERLAAIGVDLDRDCRKTNAVCCRPPANRAPTAKEIDACRPRLDEEFARNKPKVVVLLGATALESWIGLRWKRAIGGIGRWRGFAIPDVDRGCWVVATYHPSYLLRLGPQAAENKVFDADLRLAFSLVDKKLPRDIRQEIRITNNHDEIVDFLRRVDDDSCSMAFDYETNCLNPHHPNAHILSFAVAANIGKNRSLEVIAFPYDQLDIVPVWQKLMANRHVKKIAANMKFEHKWTHKHMNVDVHGWTIDTMLAAHVLDNRPDITGLKFQAAVNFGIFDYDSAVEPMLKAKDKTGLNEAHRIPIKDLLTYNGMDALIEYRLAALQTQRLIDEKLLDGYWLLHHGALALCDIEMEGVPFDEKYCKEKIKEFQAKEQAQDKLIYASDEWKMLVKQYGQDANYNSGAQLGWLLYDELGLTPSRRTATGKGAVDAATLEKVDSNFARAIITQRKLAKARATYFEGFLAASQNDTLHPNFNLHTTVTYRSSSDDPNFQNIPVRNPEIARQIRGAFKPDHPDMIIGEADYSGIEVRVAACYHKDPTMIKYITKGYDMHRDMAAECYMCAPDQVSKDMRYCGKNKFVFPAFYGSYYEDMAPALWSAIKDMKLKMADGQPLATYLRNEKGMKLLEDFKQHIQEVEYRFWNERFKVYGEWRKRWYEKYLREMTFRAHTGFRYVGPMRRNEVINFPVQGSAFHCLLWSLTRIHRQLKKEKWQTRIIGQVHDSMIFIAAPDEIDDFCALVRRVSCEEIREAWPWLIVPLDVEIETAPPGMSWADKKPYKTEGK